VKLFISAIFGLQLSAFRQDSGASVGVGHHAQCSVLAAVPVFGLFDLQPLEDMASQLLKEEHSTAPAIATAGAVNRCV
jgi:hypothetical protein